MTPIGYLVLLSGGWLWLVNSITGPWLHAKLTLVVLLVGYNHYCRRLLRDFEAGSQPARPRLVPLVQRSADVVAGSRGVPRRAQTFLGFHGKFFATCPRGLEPLLSDDIAATGATELETVTWRRAFPADWQACYAVNTCCRHARAPARGARPLCERRHPEAGAGCAVAVVQRRADRC